MILHALCLTVLAGVPPEAPLTEGCCVRPHHGQPTLHIDGQPAYPFMYLPHGGDHDRQYRQFASTGAHYYSFGCPLGNDKPGEFNAAAVDRVFNTLSAADPQAWLLPRISVTAPGWWLTAHPDDCVRYDNDATGPQSFASTAWRRDIGDHLTAFVHHVCAQPYGRRVIGFHLCTGVTAEWQSWGLWDDRRGDFSPVALAAWRDWLGRQYRTDEALRRAWGRGDVTLTAAQVPTRQRREAPSPRFLRSPIEYRDVIDFYRFYPELVADSIIELAARATRACQDRALVGVFYGYAAQYGGRAQESQHLALAKVLACADVDFLCSPAMYSDRGPGGSSTFMSATGSVNLNGKLWFHEADNRTHLVKPDSPFAPVAPAKNLAESRGVLQREFGHCIQRAAPLWWFDMGGGWYDDPAILADFTEMNRIAGPLVLAGPDLLPKPAIAVIHGYHSYPREQPEHGYLHESVCAQVVSLSHIGGPSELYLLDDLDRVSPARLYLFMNCTDLTSADRRRINRLKHDGNTLVFTWTAGLGRLTGNGDITEDIGAMSDLLGLNMELSEQPLAPRARFVEEHPYRQEPGLPTAFGHEHPLAPSVHCVQPDVQVLARYDGTDQPAVVVKSFADHTVVWSGAAPVPPELLRALARQSGVHIYTTGGDPLFAGHNLITVHAATAGAKTIVLPDDLHAEALFGAPAARRAGRTLTFDLNRADTRAFRISR